MFFGILGCKFAGFVSFRNILYCTVVVYFLQSDIILDVGESIV